MVDLIKTEQPEIHHDGRTEVVLKLREFWSKPALKKFEIAIREIFKTLYNFASHLTVEKGCICLSWIVPCTNVKNLFVTDPEDKMFLRVIGVISICIGNRTLYSTQEDGCEVIEAALLQAKELNCTRAMKVLKILGHDPLVVLITGGCGFLGPHIGYWAYSKLSDTTKIVLLDNAIANQTACVEMIAGEDKYARISVEHADITDPTSVRTVFEKHKPDVVFHCAALSHMSATFAGLIHTRMERVNVHGTQCIVNECIHAGVRVLIYTGSLTQVLPTGIHNQQLQIDEQYVPPNNMLLAETYGQTKKKGERLVLDAKDQLLTCSIRCPPMYGEHDKKFIPRVVSAAERFWGIYPSSGNSQRTMAAMYVGNAAWAHVCAAKRLLDKSNEVRRSVNGEVFFVGDDTPQEWAIDFYKRFLKPLHYQFSPRVPVIIPTIFFYIYVAIILFFWVFFDMEIPNPISNYRWQINVLSVSHKVMFTKAKRLLNYEPQTHSNVAIKNSLNTWYYRNYHFLRGITSIHK